MDFWNQSLLTFSFYLPFGIIFLHASTLQSEDISPKTYAAIQPPVHDLGREKLLTCLAGEWVSRCLYVATRLEIADHLQQGPKSAKELAQLSYADPDSLHRILRLLASVDIFQEDEEGIFSNNQVSNLLAKNHPQSLHALSLFYGEEIHSSWTELLESIRMGIPAFEIVHQQPLFAYFKDHPFDALLFQEAMKEKSKAVIQSALTAYDFGKFQSIYDIGAGHGQFMQALLDRYPHMTGLVFDLKEVIETLPLKNSSLPKNRCRLVGGDFFISIPQGGDVYILKSILHDWNDEEANKILKNCYQAMTSNSRLLIVEVILFPKQRAAYAKCMDVLTLTVTGGKERTLASFEQILNRAGFKIESIYSTSTEFSIIEACKKD